jgi:hypothetical protein
MAKRGQASAAPLCRRSGYNASLDAIFGLDYLGDTLFGSGALRRWFKLPAFNRGLPGAQEQPATIASDEGDDSAAGVTPDRPANREVALQTDKPEYAPGEVIVVTGSGWDPGERVTGDIQALWSLRCGLVRSCGRQLRSDPGLHVPIR